MGVLSESRSSSCVGSETGNIGTCGNEESRRFHRGGTGYVVLHERFSEAYRERVPLLVQTGGLGDSLESTLIFGPLGESFQGNIQGAFAGLLIEGLE